MAFNQTDAELAALQSEVLTDPIGMGYAAVVDQTQQLLKLLNDPDNNVGGDILGESLTPTLLLDAVDPTDYGANQAPAGIASYVHTLVEAGNQAIDLEPYRVKVRALFDLIPQSNTVKALDEQTRAVSRAEVLFGVDTVITRDDWIAARDYQG